MLNIPIEIFNLIQLERLSTVRVVACYLEKPDREWNIKRLCNYTGLSIPSVQAGLDEARTKGYLAKKNEKWFVKLDSLTPRVITNGDATPLEIADGAYVARKKWDTALEPKEARQKYLSKASRTELTERDMLHYFCQLYREHYNYEYVALKNDFTAEAGKLKKYVLGFFLASARESRKNMADVEIEVLEFFKWIFKDFKLSSPPTLKYLPKIIWRYVDYKHKRKVVVQPVKKQGEYDGMSRGDILRHLERKFKKAETKEDKIYYRDKIRYYTDLWYPED